MQGIIHPVDLFVENCAILIMWRENHPFAAEVLPVGSSDQSNTHSEFGNFCKRQAESVLHCRYAAVFDAKSFEFAFTKYGWITCRFMEMNSIFTAYEAQIGECCEVIFLLIIDDARVGRIEIGIVFIEA